MEVMTGNLDIRFSDEQAMMLETAEAFCRNKSPIAAVRGRLAGELDDAEALWREMSELGWLGIAVPEEFGGVGLGLAEAVTVIEPMGRHLLASPFMGTTLLAQALLQAGTEAQQRDWLPGLCSGTAGALAFSEAHGDWDLRNLHCKAERQGEAIRLSGQKTFVLHADKADLLLLSVNLDGAPALALLETANLGPDALNLETILDETRRSFRLDLDGLDVPAANLLQIDKTTACLDYLDQAACLLLSAEMCGGMAAVMQVTVDYLNSRRQFDRFIGAYQGLKHPMADILTQYEGGRSLLYHAASVFDAGGPDAEAVRETAVRMAKSYISEGFAYAGDRAIQFHGAFGFTYDCDAQLFLRRALWCQSQFGDGPYQRGKLQDLLL
jgi:acyl-CoA dehydrogenase